MSIANVRFHTLAVVCMGLLLTTLARAEIVVGGNVVWPAGSTQVLPDDMLFTGSLTIEPGVTVQIEANRQLRIGPGATLTAIGTSQAPITFTCRQIGLMWSGLVLQQGASASIEHATLTKVRPDSIALHGATLIARRLSVLAGDVPPFLLTEPSSSLIRVDGGHLEITESVIGPYTSLAGSPGPATPPNGSGLPGFDGQQGADLAAIRIRSNGTAVILNNRFEGLVGGRGGAASEGAGGAQGAMGSEGTLLSPTGGPGGPGTPGGRGGNGGRGGSCAIVVTELAGEVLIAQNIITNCRGGNGGPGARGGRGGAGGTGGTGTSGVLQGGDGGPGGAGGTGGAGGMGGDAGAFQAFLFLDLAGSAPTVRLANNTVVGIDSGTSGAGGPFGFGGFGGAGGAGGANPFENGDQGPGGPAGSNGASGEVGLSHRCVAVRAISVSGQTPEFESRNNIFVFGRNTPGQRQGFVLEGPSSASTDFDMLFGWDGLTSGAISFGNNNTITFLDPQLDANFMPEPGSPAIDSGDNSSVPAELNALDFLGEGRFRDDPSAPDTGVGPAPVVDRGAVEAQGIVTCPGDIADDFGTLGGDDQVSFGDFLALLGLVGPCPGGTPGCDGDIADDFGTLGGDGVVGFGDFLALLAIVGPCP